MGRWGVAVGRGGVISDACGRVRITWLSFRNCVFLRPEYSRVHSWVDLVSS